MRVENQLRRRLESEPGSGQMLGVMKEKDTSSESITPVLLDAHAPFPSAHTQHAPNPGPTQPRPSRLGQVFVRMKRLYMLALFSGTSQKTWSTPALAVRVDGGDVGRALREDVERPVGKGKKRKLTMN